jgi:tRNA U34 2-thiouridine synthase MnmA/TrmU
LIIFRLKPGDPGLKTGRKINNMKIKALVLFSGGLDSMLAVKILERQNIKVDGVCFRSGFFEPHNAVKSAAEIGLDLVIVDISEEILKLVKNPPSGYGKNLNPCIDCHSLMIKTAGKLLTPPQPSPSPSFAEAAAGKQGEGVNTPLLTKEGSGEVYDIIATGEVLGQRPFSQNKAALLRVSKLSGVDVLRPLSAKLLPATKAEEKGLVNRGKLLSIQGRGRDKQLELIRKYGIKKFPMPAGGCLLTDPVFCERLGVLMDNWLRLNNNDIQLIKNGRIFWLKDQADRKILVILGRKEEENASLKKLAQKGDFVLELKEIAGPTVLVRNMKSKGKLPDELSIQISSDFKLSALKITEEKDNKNILETAAMLAGYYSKKAGGNVVVMINKV